MARAITLVESGGPRAKATLGALPSAACHRVGVTGPPGVGKSTLVGKLAALSGRRGLKTAVVACDPVSPISGGAFLGDRMRMLSTTGDDPHPFIRSMASPGPGADLPQAALDAARILAAAGFVRVYFETPGSGQNDVGLAGRVDTVVVVLSPDLGDEYQLLKAGQLEVADILVVNRADRPGAGAMAELLRQEVHARSRGPSSEVALVSAVSGDGVEALFSAIEARAHNLEAKQ